MIYKKNRMSTIFCPIDESYTNFLLWQKETMHWGYKGGKGPKS
jgi:hypothetical protein